MKTSHVIIIGLLALIAAAAVFIAVNMPRAPMSEYAWLLAHPPPGQTRDTMVKAGEKDPDWTARMKDTPHKEDAP